MNAASHIEVSQLWGDSLLRVERFSRWRRLTVGPLGSSDFAAALDEPTVLVDRGVIRGDEGEVEITADTDVLVDVGEQTFRVRAVAPERHVGGALFAHVDWFFIGVALIGLVSLVLATIVTLLAIVAFLLFRYVLAFVLALFAMQPPVFLQLPPVIVPPPPIVASATIAPIEEASSPARPFFVRATPTPIPTIAPIPIGDIYSAKLSRSRESELMMDLLSEDRVGVLAALTTNENTLTGIFGSGGLGEARGDDVAIGGLRGTGLGGGGSAVGIGGLGVRGSGGTGRVGTGDPKVRKVEPVRMVEKAVAYEEPEGDEYGYEEGGVEGGVAGGEVGGVVGGVIGGYVPPPHPPMMGGTLATEEISRTINANVSKIRGCYEKALGADPNLEGRVVVSFIVDAEGDVWYPRVVSSSIPVINACVVSAVQQMRFPQPAPGGGAKVTYPFVFNRR